MATSNGESFEVLRVWTAPGQTQEVVLKTTWKNPATWGLMLADTARHAANAYANEGHDRWRRLRGVKSLWGRTRYDLTQQAQLKRPIAAASLRRSPAVEVPARYEGWSA